MGQSSNPWALQRSDQSGEATLRTKLFTVAALLAASLGSAGAQDKPIIDQLNKALAAALEDEAVVKRFAQLGYDVVPPEQRSHAYFDKFFKDEIALWTKVLGGLSVAPKQ